jgi:hypothetical protein
MAPARLAADLEQERRWPRLLSIPFSRVSKSELAPGSGHADIGHSPLLLEVFTVRMRQNTIFHANQQNRVPFKSLGGMNGRQQRRRSAADCALIEIARFTCRSQSPQRREAVLCRITRPFVELLAPGGSERCHGCRRRYSDSPSGRQSSRSSGASIRGRRSQAARPVLCRATALAARSGEDHWPERRPEKCNNHRPLI